MDVHPEELEHAANSKIYAHMWVAQMDSEVRNDNEITRKLLDVVKDLDKSLTKRHGIIDELKVKKGMRGWKAVTYTRIGRSKSFSFLVPDAAGHTPSFRVDRLVKRLKRDKSWRKKGKMEVVDVYVFLVIYNGDIQFVCGTAHMIVGCETFWMCGEDTMKEMMTDVKQQQQKFLIDDQPHVVIQCLKMLIKWFRLHDVRDQLLMLPVVSRIGLKEEKRNEPLAILLDESQIDDKLNFIEERVKIMDREVKRLKQSHIPIVNVCWNSRRGLKFTWEREDPMKKKYPHLFLNPSSTSLALRTKLF
nr:putative reverse transcriptase domain-containing protein [Tanacetum cinerariifolium]